MVQDSCPSIAGLNEFWQSDQMSEKTHRPHQHFTHSGDGFHHHQWMLKMRAKDTSDASFFWIHSSIPVREDSVLSVSMNLPLKDEGLSCIGVISTKEKYDGGKMIIKSYCCLLQWSLRVIVASQKILCRNASLLWVWPQKILVLCWCITVSSLASKIMRIKSWQKSAQPCS